MDKPWKEHFREPAEAICGKAFADMSAICLDKDYAAQQLKKAAASYEEAQRKFVELARFPNRETLRGMLADLANAGRLMGVAEAAYSAFSPNGYSPPIVKTANDQVNSLIIDILASFHTADASAEASEDQ